MAEQQVKVYHIALEDADGDYGHQDILAKIPLVLTARNKYEVYELIGLGMFKAEWTNNLKQHQKEVDDKHQVSVAAEAFGAPFGWVTYQRDPNYQGPAVEPCPYVDLVTPHYSKMDWDTTRHPACRLAHLCGFRVYGSEAGEAFDLDKTLAGVDLSALLALSRTGRVTGEFFQIACSLAPFHVKRVDPLPNANELTKTYVSGGL